MERSVGNCEQMEAGSATRITILRLTQASIYYIVLQEHLYILISYDLTMFVVIIVFMKSRQCACLYYAWLATGCRTKQRLKTGLIELQAGRAEAAVVAVQHAAARPHWSPRHNQITGRPAHWSTRVLENRRKNFGQMEKHLGRRLENGQPTALRLLLGIRLDC